MIDGNEVKRMHSQGFHRLVYYFKHLNRQMWAVWLTGGRRGL